MENGVFKIIKAYEAMIEYMMHIFIFNSEGLQELLHVPLYGFDHFWLRFTVFISRMFAQQHRRDLIYTLMHNQE